MILILNHFSFLIPYQAQWIELLCIRTGWLLQTLVILVSISMLKLLTFMF